MGVDKNSVVDPELKGKKSENLSLSKIFNSLFSVYGIKSLRVVDGSIIPEIPASHTNAVIFMIGEKAADMIKRTWANT